MFPSESPFARAARQKVAEDSQWESVTRLIHTVAEAQSRGDDTVTLDVRPGSSTLGHVAAAAPKVAATDVTISQVELENLYQSLNEADFALDRVSNPDGSATEAQRLVGQARDLVYSHLR